LIIKFLLVCFVFHLFVGVLIRVDTCNLGLSLYFTKHDAVFVESKGNIFFLEAQRVIKK